MWGAGPRNCVFFGEKSVVAAAGRDGLLILVGRLGSRFLAAGRDGLLILVGRLRSRVAAAGRDGLLILVVVVAVIVRLWACTTVAGLGALLLCVDSELHGEWRRLVFR